MCGDMVGLDLEILLFLGVIVEAWECRRHDCGKTPVSTKDSRRVESKLFVVNQEPHTVEYNSGPMKLDGCLDV